MIWTISLFAFGPRFLSFPASKVGKSQPHDMLDRHLACCYNSLREWGRSSGGERLLGMEKVEGSIPSGSTNLVLTGGAGKYVCALFVLVARSRGVVCATLRPVNLPA